MIPCYGPASRLKDTTPSGSASIPRSTPRTPAVARCQRRSSPYHALRMHSVSGFVLLSVIFFLVSSCRAAPVTSPALEEGSADGNALSAAHFQSSLPLAPSATPVPDSAWTDGDEGPAWSITADKDGDGGSSDEDAAENGKNNDLIPPPLGRNKFSVFKILLGIGTTVAAICALVILRPSTLPPAARKLLFSPLLTAANVSDSVSSSVRRTGEQLRRAKGAIQRKAGGHKGSPSDSPDFRVGEDRLVSWAQEDLGFDTLGAGAEEDVMVNDGHGHGHRAPLAEPVLFSQVDEDDWDNYAAGRGEYIPLKPSPAFGNMRVSDPQANGGKKGKGYWFRYGYGTIG